MSKNSECNNKLYKISTNNYKIRLNQLMYYQISKVISDHQVHEQAQYRYKLGSDKSNSKKNCNKSRL